jgi:hypothetical protein
MDTQYETPAEFLARWQRVGPQLAAIGRQELRTMSADEHQRQIASVLALADHSLPLRPTSGLVQLQQILKRRYHERTA